MSWIKNQFNKLFKMEENGEYEEYIEEIEQPVEQNRSRQQDVYKEPQPQKKTFRFPLIDDEYEAQAATEQVQQTKPRVESHSTGFYDEDNEQLSLPNHLQKRTTNKVLDVEVSGIRDLLERRRKGKGHSTVIRTPEPVRKVPVSKEERQVLTKNPKREDSKINKEFINPLENRKRFVPTEVPSPVHGFLKPTPIEQLIEKQHDLQHKLEEVPINKELVEELVEQPTPVVEPIVSTKVEDEKLAPQVEMASTTEPQTEMPVYKEPFVEEAVEPVMEPVEVQQAEIAQEPTEPVVEQPITDSIETQAEPILFEDEPAATKEQDIIVEPVIEPVKPPAILLEDDEQVPQESSVQDVLNDVQVKHVTIENSTIHIGQLNVEQLPQQEQEKILEQAQQVTPATQPETSGSRLPFNVLMLKSDKQKLLTKQFVAQQIGQSDATPENKLAAEETPTVAVDVQLTNEINFDQSPIQAKRQAEVPQEQEPVETEVQPEPQEVVESVIDVENIEPVETLEVLEQQSTQMTSIPAQAIEQKELTISVEVPQTNGSAERTNVYEEQAQLTAIGLLEREQQNLVEVQRDDEPAIVHQTELQETESIIEVVPIENKTTTSVESESKVDASVQELVEVPETEAVSTPQINEEQTLEPMIAIAPIIEATPNETLEQINEVVATIAPDPIFSPVVENEPEVEQPVEVPVKKRIPYVKPPLEYLVPPEEMIEDRDWMDEQGENLVEALSYFQIQANIESIVQGPAVTQFEITVGQGTKVSKVRNLADDIKLALAAKDIRIDAPIPGKRSIGIEIPNRISRSVRLSEVTDSESFRNSDSPLEAALGLDLTGKPVTIDLRKMPHGLIAGATGSGKSVCINSILVSLLYKADPNELKLMLIDPKMVELAPFNHIPHLVSPVITDVKAATAALKWAVEEMERRYQLFMHSGARKIEAYNKMCDENGMYAQKLPYLLIVIDELADLMMMSPQDVEDSIVRITQKARAAGIHLIVATQRPSVDVITGLIKSNIPTRIAFSVSSQIDSRTILDAQGAERLLGRGDMLYLGNGMSAPTRIQGTFVTDDEIEEIIDFVREQGEPEYIFKQEELLKRSEAVEDQDELFEEVCRFVYEQGSASTSLLQRKYHIGYNRAARLIDMLERQGYVSEPKGSKPRDVFITEEDLAIQFGD